MGFGEPCATGRSTTSPRTTRPLRRGSRKATHSPPGAASRAARRRPRVLLAEGLTSKDIAFLCSVGPALRLGPAGRPHRARLERRSAPARSRSDLGADGRRARVPPSAQRLRRPRPSRPHCAHASARPHRRDRRPRRWASRAGASCGPGLVAPRLVCRRGRARTAHARGGAPACAPGTRGRDRSPAAPISWSRSTPSASGPTALIDLGRVPELRGWRYEGDELVLGATLTYTEACGGEVASALPALAAAARTVGSPQIRNRGTIGGNLGTGSPAGDALPPLLIEDARRRAGLDCAGTRTLPLAEFLLGPQAHRTGADDELVVAVRVRPSRAPQTFMKIGPRNAMVISICSLALSADRERGELRAAFGSSGARRRGSCTAPLEEADGFAEQVVAAASPIDDVRGTAAYRRHALGVLTRRGTREVPRMRIELRVNGEPRRGRRAGRGEPAVRAARAARPAGRQGGVRGGRVRVLLGAARRRARVPLPRARRAGRRAGSRDGRGAGSRGAAACRAARVRRRRRRAVRLLHARPRRRHGRAARRARAIRPTTTSARRSRATSAAARATAASSPPCAIAAAELRA